MAASVPIDQVHRRFTADRAQDDERRAKAQQQRQHMADYYARLTQEQEDRENGEARERFAESQRKRQGGS